MASKVILKMMGASGRLRYDLLKKCAEQNAHDSFQSQFIYPVLVGMALFQGEMETRIGKNATMAFSLQDIKNELNNHAEQDESDPAGLHRAIYPIIKQEFSTSPQDSFFVGREEGNDLVMVDYTISRKHAVIKVQDGKCSVMDCGSTNGTTLNGNRLEPSRPHRFKAEDELGFGRFRFKALSGTTLYIQLRSS